MPTQDHPHAYGDKLYSIVVPLDENGSSPRVWGQALVKPLCCAGKRIIPTRMGTRDTHDGVCFPDRDHPHAYGDKNQVQRNGLQYIGSSPRVWGQVFKTISKRSNSRIIPTRMGTSKNRSNENSQRQDHPHAYGDKFFWFYFASSA